MIRARVRNDGTPSYSYVLSVIQAYENTRRAFGHKFYRAMSDAGDPVRHRNWSHFVRAAKVIYTLNMTPQEYMQIQFVEASRTSYPRPSNLYSKKSIRRAKEKAIDNKEILLLKTNEAWLEHYAMLYPSVRKEVLVLWPAIKFSAWFRIYHCGLLVPEPLIEEARSQLSSGDFLSVLASHGYNIDILKKKLDLETSDDE